MHISNTFLNANNKFAFFKNMTLILNSFVPLTSNFQHPLLLRRVTLFWGKSLTEESRLIVLVEDCFHTFWDELHISIWFSFVSLVNTKYITLFLRKSKPSSIDMRRPCPCSTSTVEDISLFSELVWAFEMRSSLSKVLLCL